MQRHQTADEIKRHEKKVYLAEHDAGKSPLDRRGWTLQQKVAVAARFLADHGHGSALAGQISARTGDGSYWTQSYGRGLDETRSSNLVRINANLEVLEGKGKPNPANRFHSYVYSKRPDVRAIVHTHPPFTSALAMIGRPLVPSHMDTVALWSDVAHLASWPGVPFGDEEGEVISSALGSKRAILLAHHGLLTVGGSIEEASVLAMIFEQAARLQLVAMSAGEIRPLPEREGREGHEFASKPLYYASLFDYYARRFIARDPSCLE
jgi:L-fuculose-phosphate aldolase